MERGRFPRRVGRTPPPQTLRGAGGGKEASSPPPRALDSHLSSVSKGPAAQLRGSREPPPAGGAPHVLESRAGAEAAAALASAEAPRLQAPPLAEAGPTPTGGAPPPPRQVTTAPLRGRAPPSWLGRGFPRVRSRSSRRGPSLLPAEPRHVPVPPFELALVPNLRLPQLASVLAL